MILKGERKAQCLREYCKTAQNHRSLTLILLSGGVHDISTFNTKINLPFFQTVSEGIRCRCGNINNLDSSEPAYHSHCDTPCNDPNGQATIDLRCPILDHQLIYRTGGKLFAVDF